MILSLFQTQFLHRLQFLKFLTLLWSSTAWQKSSSDPSDLPVPNAIVVVQSLHVAKFLIPSLDHQSIEEITSEKSQGNCFSKSVCRIAKIVINCFKVYPYS